MEGKFSAKSLTLTNTQIPEVGSSRNIILGMLSSCTAIVNLFRWGRYIKS